MHPFGTALEARDVDAAVALLHEDVVFRSPVVFKPYRGRASVAPILRAVEQVLDDFGYVRHFGAPAASDYALVFRARVGGNQIEGCDFLHTDDQGLIDELMVMVRPLSAALALAEAMQVRLAANGSARLHA